LFYVDGGQAGLQTDRRADMTTLIAAFRNFANALKNVSSCRILAPIHNVIPFIILFSC
jgi:hypothetical protein